MPSMVSAVQDTKMNPQFFNSGSSQHTQKTHSHGQWDHVCAAQVHRWLWAENAAGVDVMTSSDLRWPLFIPTLNPDAFLFLP